MSASASVLGDSVLPRTGGANEGAVGTTTEEDGAEMGGERRDSDRVVTSAECRARHDSINMTLDDLKNDNKRMFWMQLTNLGGVIAVLASIVTGLAVAALISWMSTGTVVP